MVTFIKPRSDRVFLLVTCAIILIGISQEATLEEERASEKVKIKMYDLSTSDWTSSKQNTFRTVISTQAIAYCGNSPSSCGLDSAVGFTLSEVGVSSAERDGSSIEFTFYIDYPSGAAVSAGGDTTLVVPSTAAQAIAAAARDEVKDQVGYYITYIDEEYYSIPPDTDTNKVIIPIAFVVVFLLAVTVLALHYHQKHKERQELIKKRLIRKKQHQQQLSTSPSYSALDNTATTILTTNNSTTPRRGYGNNSNTNNGYSFVNTTSHTKLSTRDQVSVNKSTEDDGPLVVSLAKTKTHQQHRPMTSSSVNDFHDGQYVYGAEDTATTLPAVEPKQSVMNSLEDDEAKRERRRKRKEKKRERRRREEEEGGERAMETSYENPVFNSSNLSEGSYSYQY